MARRDLPLAWQALRTAVIASSALAAAALTAGMVRLLPWIVDPAVPWRVAAPFARGLASIAIEAALLVGWPVGWALACFRFVESGEARVLQTLGERPARTVLRLAPQAALFAGALASVALVWGRDANEPGRVATELIAEAKTSCARAKSPLRYAVPFTELTWLCSAGSPPRLVGAAPSLAGVVFSATDARISGDFRGIDLDDAHLLLAAPRATSGLRAEAHVGALHVRGLSPWSRAATLPFVARAVLFAVTGAVAAAITAFATLGGAARGRMGAVVLGAVGPLAALGLVRVLERTDAGVAVYATVPLATIAAAITVALLGRLQLAARARRGNERPT